MVTEVRLSSLARFRLRGGRHRIAASHNATPPRIIGYAVVAFVSVLAVGAVGPGSGDSEPRQSAASDPEPGVPFQAEALVPSPPRAQAPAPGPQLPGPELLAVRTPEVTVPTATSLPTAKASGPSQTAEQETSEDKAPATSQPSESTRPSETTPPPESSQPSQTPPPSESTQPSESAPPPSETTPPSSEQPEPTQPGLLPTLGGAVDDLTGGLLPRR